MVRLQGENTLKLHSCSGTWHLESCSSVILTEGVVSVTCSCLAVKNLVAVWYHCRVVWWLWWSIWKHTKQWGQSHTHSLTHLVGSAHQHPYKYTHISWYMRMLWFAGLYSIVLWRRKSNWAATRHMLIVIISKLDNWRQVLWSFGWWRCEWGYASFTVAMWCFNVRYAHHSSLFHSHAHIHYTLNCNKKAGLLKIYSDAARIA